MSEKWKPCKASDHDWFRTKFGYYCCKKESCAVTGWTKNQMAFGRIVVPFQLKITIYRCSSCHGPTTVPLEVCPNCRGMPKKRVSKSRAVKEVHSWDDLTREQQMFLSFLSTKDKPSCVGRSNGGGCAPSLSTRGLIERQGDASGQAKWVLSDFGRSLYEESDSGD